MNKTIDEIPRPWLTVYRKGVPASVGATEHVNLGSFLESLFFRYADEPAFSNFRRTLSFAEIGIRAKAFAAYLQTELGYQPGERLALMMPNILQFPICLYGCMLAGIVVVNVNPLYTARELEHQLKDSDARGIVIAENFAATLAQVRHQLPGLKDVVITRYGDEMGWFWSPIVDFYVKHVAKLVTPYTLPDTLSLKTLLQKGRKMRYTAAAPAGDDIALLQYTGGTTGVAKGAMLTHTNILTNARQIDLWIGGESVGIGDIAIVPLPLYHIFCCTVNCIAFPGRGMHSVLITNPRDTKDFVGILKKYPFTLITGVNTLFRGLLNQKSFRKLDFSKLRFVVGGGMPLEKKVSDDWREITGNVIIEGYGMTETSPLLCVNSLFNSEYTGGIGYPISGTDVSLRDENGQTVAPGTPGEMWVRGPQVMKGYWQQEAETRQVMTADGWLKTGDIAVMREDGFLRIVDRKKDMILVSGFNVYPSEVEAVLKEHPDVAEAACVGVKNQDGSGEVVKAFIVLYPGKRPTVEALKLFVSTRLTGYKRPKLYEFLDELPKSAVGKILRRELTGNENTAKNSKS